MSFLRKLSRTKSTDTHDKEQPDKDKVKRRSYSGSLPTSKDDKQKERKHSVKDKKKSKSENGGGGGGGLKDVEYPLFYVHYLGRVPTKLEYGHQAVEGPVDQLCQLREKEKLPKLVLTFNSDGLFFREITGTFNRVKKDGMFIFIPLHMVTYGVGSVAHPNVFACVTRTVLDKVENTSEMFIVHAFLCEKSSVAQKMTYWQLQAYIEAYETLKRKKELRMQKKLRNSLKADTSSINTSTTTLSLSSHEGSTTSRDSERQKIQDSNFINPKLEKLRDSTSNERLLEKDKTNANEGSQIYAQVHKTTVSSTTTDEPTNEFNQSTPERHSATSIGSRTSKDSALGDELTGDQTNEITGDSQAPQEIDPFSFGQATTPAVNTVPVSRSNGSQRRASSSVTDDKLDTISVVTMPMDAESVPRDQAFEKRITELNRLMQVDAEDLKSKLIKENPTLVRRLYYGTIDRHGVFHRQGLNLGMDADNSYA